MKEHDEIDEFFRATFQDFKPDASHISDAGLSSFLKSQSAAKTSVFAKWGIGAYTTVGTAVVAASVVAVQLFSSTPQKQTKVVSHIQPVSTEQSIAQQEFTDNETETSGQLILSQPDSTLNTTTEQLGTRTFKGSSGTLTEPILTSTERHIDNTVQKRAGNPKSVRKTPTSGNQQHKQPTAESIRAIEDYLAEKYPVPLYFNPDDGAAPHSSTQSAVNGDTLANEANAPAESAVLYTEVQIPLAAETGMATVAESSVTTTSQTLESALPQDSGVVTLSNQELGYKINPAKTYVWPAHSVSVSGGLGFAALSKTGNDYASSPYFYPYNAVISGSTDVEKMLALRYDYRLPGHIAVQAGLNYQTLGWDYVRSVIFIELLGNPDSSYYQLDTADAYRQQVSLRALGLSLATGYDILLSEKWMLGLRFGLSGNQYHSKLTETDLWNGTQDAYSERNVFVLAAFGRFNAVYRFGKFGIGAGVSVNGRSAMTRALEYSEIYQNVSYGIDLGIHYYPGN